MLGLTELTDKQMRGARLRWWQGVAYRRLELRSSVVAPIPLNWVIGKARDWYWRIVQGPTCERDERIQAALDVQWSEMNEQRWQDRFDDEARGYKKGWLMHREQISEHFKNFLEDLKKERHEP